MFHQIFSFTRSKKYLSKRQNTTNPFLLIVNGMFTEINKSTIDTGKCFPESWKSITNSTLLDIFDSTFKYIVPIVSTILNVLGFLISPACKVKKLIIKVISGVVAAISKVKNMVTGKKIYFIEKRLGTITINEMKANVMKFWGMNTSQVNWLFDMVTDKINEIIGKLKNELNNLIDKIIDSFKTLLYNYF